MAYWPLATFEDQMNINNLAMKHNKPKNNNRNIEMKKNIDKKK